MTRRKSRPDLDTFHAHLDALKLSFSRERGRNWSTSLEYQ